jgi:hypothetical protein
LLESGFLRFYGTADLATGHDTYTNSIVVFGGMEEDNGVSGDEFFSGIVAATELPCTRQGAQTSPLRVSRPAAVSAQRILGRAQVRRPSREIGRYAAKRLRPFDRRRFRTSRPPRVLMRLRKPCSRLRLILRG